MFKLKVTYWIWTWNWLRRIERQI